LYKFFVHMRHPSYRLVISGDAPFPAGASEHEWRFTRAREASDVNAEVRDAVNPNRLLAFQNRIVAFRDS
jgi:hypothetical protein